MGKGVEERGEREMIGAGFSRIETEVCFGCVPSPHCVFAFGVFVMVCVHGTYQPPGTNASWLCYSR